MTEEKEMKECCSKGKCMPYSAKGQFGGGIYGLAFIGALIYFLQNATTFWMGVLGVLKAMVWPAMLVYNALKFLNIQ